MLINGVDISTLDEDQLAALRNKTIGFVFQFHYLLDEFSCLENALLPIVIERGVATDAEQQRIIKLLTRVDLGHRLNNHPDEMSGGQNQRCAIVRALANEPRVVLADEPTGNFDSQSGTEVFKLMREMNRETGVAFVMVTHDDRLAQAADRILVIEDGRIHPMDGHSVIL